VGRDITQSHEFKCWMPRMPMVLVFPAATNLYFPYGSLNGKWKSNSALLPLSASPLGTKMVKSQGNSDSSASKARAPKHKPNNSHNASVLANLESPPPQRSASILNGNYCTHTYKHTQHLDFKNEMQKTKRRNGGVLEKVEQKMRYTEERKLRKCNKERKYGKKKSDGYVNVKSESSDGEGRYNVLSWPGGHGAEYPGASGGRWPDLCGYHYDEGEVFSIFSSILPPFLAQTPFLSQGKGEAAWGAEEGEG